MWSVKKFLEKAKKKKKDYLKNDVLQVDEIGSGDLFRVDEIGSGTLFRVDEIGSGTLFNERKVQR